MGLPLFCLVKIEVMDRRCWKLGLLACLLLAGCTTTRYVPVPQVSVDSVYVDRWLRDSVYLHDSVFVDRWTQGDTVHVDRMVTKYRYRDRWRHDTVAVLRADTVSVPCPVEKESGWWQRVRMDAFPVLLGIVAVLAFTVVWLVKKARKKQ